MLLLLQVEEMSLSTSSCIQDVKGLYNLAISVAGRFDGVYLQNQALACERAGIFCLERKDIVACSAYLTRPRHVYILWVAAAKARQMEVNYWNVLAQNEVPDKVFATAQQPQ
jgi:hypothetical protein